MERNRVANKLFLKIGAFRSDRVGLRACEREGALQWQWKLVWQHWECLYFFILERFLEVGPWNWIHWFCQKKELEFWQSTDLVLLGPSVSLGITASEPMTKHCWGTILILWCWWIGKIDSQNFFLVKQAVEHGLYLDRIQLSHFPKEWSFLVKKKLLRQIEYI